MAWHYAFVVDEESATVKIYEVYRDLPVEDGEGGIVEGQVASARTLEPVGEVKADSIQDFTETLYLFLNDIKRAHYYVSEDEMDGQLGVND